jgi:hypothetical protein
MTMNQPAYSISKQNIHLLGFYDGSDFALAKRRMHQRLSFAVRTAAVVGQTSRLRNSRYRAAFVWNSGIAYWTNNARNASSLVDGDYDVTAHVATGQTHLLNAVSSFENSFFHTPFSFVQTMQ